MLISVCAFFVSFFGGGAAVLCSRSRSRSLTHPNKTDINPNQTPNSWCAILVSTTLVLVVGEIVPTSIFSGARLACWLVCLLVCLLHPFQPPFTFTTMHKHTHIHTGPGQLRLAGKLTPLVWFIVGVFSPIAYPIARMLDCCLGAFCVCLALPCIACTHNHPSKLTPSPFPFQCTTTTTTTTTTPTGGGSDEDGGHGKRFTPAELAALLEIHQQVRVFVVVGIKCCVFRSW